MNRRARVLGLSLLVTTTLSAAALDRISFAPTLLGTNTPSFAAAVSDIMDGPSNSWEDSTAEASR